MLQADVRIGTGGFGKYVRKKKKEGKKMPLTIQNIKKNTAGKTFQKGKQLFENGGVESLEIDRNAETGMVYLTGVVAGNVESAYEVSVDLDEKRNFESTDSHCTCEAYRSYPGFCKHIVALQLAFIEEEKERLQKEIKEKKDDDIFDKYVVKGTEEEDYPYVHGFLGFLDEVEKIEKSRARENETEEERLKDFLGISTPEPMFRPQKTSRSIVAALQKMATDAKEQVYDLGNYQAKITIEPCLNKEAWPWSDYYHLTFRVGNDKKYVMKSISQFVQRVEEEAYFSYGKRLGFLHKRDNFAESSLPLLDFIMGYVGAKKSGNRYLYDRNDNERTMVINDILFEQFMEAFVAGKMRESNGQLPSSLSIKGSPCDWRFCVENPQLPVFIKQDQGGITLEKDRYRVFHGRLHTYVIYENTIYQCSQTFAKDMHILLDHIAEQEEIYIANEDLKNACASIIPLLYRYFDVEEENVSLEAYQPEEVQFFFYLDDEEEFGVTCRVECQYGDQRYRIFEATPPTVYRDAGKEAGVVQLLEQYFNMARRRSSDFMITEEENLYTFLQDGIEALGEMGTVYGTDAFRKNGIRQTPNVEVGVSIQSNLLDLTIQTEQLPHAELDAILKSYKLRKRYHRLKDGQFMSLEDSSLGVLSELADGLELSGKDLETGRISLPKHRALFVDAVLKDAGEQVHVHRNQLFKQLLRNIKNVEDSDYEIPAQQYAILRSYQKKGYRWLRTLREYGFGGILADDMGLGKTLQMITLLQSVLEDQAGQKMPENWRLGLIVCPASLVYNWKSEFEKFAPDIQVNLIAGTPKERASQIANGKPTEVVITSYDLLKRDVELYAQCHFDIHVLDEAQFIKNANTQAAKAVKQISSNTRIALTGTPIENRLSELWSIFDFLMPGLLFSYKHFKEEMENAIIKKKNEEGQADSKALERLRNMVRPFILRRLKEDVLKDLPKKMEHTVQCQMQGEQLKLYDARVQNLKRTLEGQSNDEFNANKLQILAELTRLRQICCDPALCYEDYHQGSAKLELCMEMVEDAVESGHKILLFSQFTTMLDTIGKALKKKKIAYYVLTGETKKEKRVELANAFNSNQVPVFLISLRAGGTGLNLTGADMVIHFDPWWNVAAQNQATDRAHRIGQKRVVSVFQMITANSIEEKIQQLQEKKKDLSDSIIAGDGMADTKLTKEDLLQILS